MKQRAAFISILMMMLMVSHRTLAQTPIIVNHQCTDLTKIPVQWIDSAKSKLHIAYGHTSHGSQIVDGMTGLVNFANGGGKGLTLPKDFFSWENGGAGGALDLRDGAMGGDVGYYPDWMNNTKAYLDDASHANVNVIMWSWCGQVDDKYAAGTLDTEYFKPMCRLEKEYPHVRFVYMTGHLDHWDDANNKAANDSIRRFCRHEGKALYDFADIESYNPDGTFFEYTNDDCSYYTSDGTQLGNWAQEWRAAHTENIDWYNCGAAHSDPLNANQKAYAAWWMFAKLAGWSGITGVENKNLASPKEYALRQNYPNPFNPATTIQYDIPAVGSQHVVTLKVYDILGHVVATLVNKTEGAGNHQTTFNASKLASGVYFYKLQTGNYTSIKKMVLMK